MPAEKTYLDFYKVTNLTSRPITLGDLVNVLIPAKKTVDLLKQPMVTKEKINQSQFLQAAIRSGWLRVTKPNMRKKSRREREAIVADEVHEEEVSLTELSDVALSSPQDNDLLQYDNGGWVNKPPSEIDIFAKIITVSSADYVALALDDVILVTTGAATRTVSFAAASTLTGKIYHIKKVDSGAGKVTLSPNGAETIDEGLTADIKFQYESIMMVSDGSNWHII